MTETFIIAHAHILQNKKNRHLIISIFDCDLLIMFFISSTSFFSIFLILF